MRVLHQKLHLQHHRHTGKVLHHKHTSYRGLAVVLVFAATAMIGLGMMARATADSLYVYARLAAPIPSTAAVITSPPDGTVTNKAGVTVAGTCPVVTPRVIIVILDNGTEAGSVACDSDNNFAVVITLSAGKNALVARSYTVTDDTGPDSAPVTVTYNPPLPPSALGTTNGTGSNSSTSNLPPLVLAIDEPFIVFGPAKDAIWTGTITGGKTPYRVSVSWNDGKTNVYTVTNSGEQNFRHHYRAMQPYDIIIQVHDASGQIVTRHYAAVTPAPNSVAGSLFAGPTRPFWGGSGLFGVYGAYLLLLATFGWMWVRAHPFAYAKMPVRRHYATAKRKRSAR